MNKLQEQRTNEQFFKSIASIMNASGVWVWPSTGHSFTIKDNKFYGSKKAVKAVRGTVTGSFHDTYFKVA